MGMNYVTLESGRVAMIGKRAKALSCLEGSVWVTAKGRSEDVLLAKGERLDLRGISRVCAQALGDSVIACLDSAPDRPHNILPWILARIAFRRSATSSISS